MSIFAPKWRGDLISANDPVTEFFPIYVRHLALTQQRLPSRLRARRSLWRMIDCGFGLGFILCHRTHPPFAELAALANPRLAWAATGAFYMRTKNPLGQVHCVQIRPKPTQEKPRSQRTCAGAFYDRAFVCGGDDPHAEILLQSHRHQCVLNITVNRKTNYALTQ